MWQDPAELKSPLHATFVLQSCPHLPELSRALDHSVTRAYRAAKCGRFYLAAISYAQSLWMEGKPAQAILQLNKAFMADLRGEEELLLRYPPPYAALAWILAARPRGYFLGNPVRHFQHLATRVSGERKEIRSWRAWACFHLSQSLLPADEFPPDLEQIGKEQLVIPGRECAVERLREDGWAGESAAYLAAFPSGALE